MDTRWTDANIILQRRGNIFIKSILQTKRMSSTKRTRNPIFAYMQQYHCVFDWIACRIKNYEVLTILPKTIWYLLHIVTLRKLILHPIAFIG